LLEAKHEIARFEGPPEYPSAMVIAEALLVNCCAGESDVSSLIQQILGVLECLLRVFFDVCYHAQRAIADIGREHRFGSEEQEKWRVASGGVGRCV
jgi:hypothetical protein